MLGTACISSRASLTCLILLGSTRVTQSHVCPAAFVSTSFAVPYGPAINPDTSLSGPFIIFLPLLLSSHFPTYLLSWSASPPLLTSAGRKEELDSLSALCSRRLTRNIN